ncbi:cell division protein ZapE [Marinicella sediminis]|uniref:Cell division protein ZapE n=1 Tax=Marinicella sediminis TaxID=1792834 RepID=A0ABV7J8M5_9GAMM|nr:cell division protein ZapE [Marinicella sediminis]
MTTGPKATYQSELDAGVIWHDALQEGVVDEFQRLHDALQQSKTNKWFFQKPDPAPQGIYIFGSVGRGKTHLMDLFYDSLPEHVGKQRQHYHEFMLWLHQQLREHGDTKNPLVHICRQLAKTTRVLCLDEFLVNDIANAMLLAGMLEAFSLHGIALVTTSNVKPDDLYQDGLQRAKFLPAIAWINQHMKVMHLDGAHDYRQQQEQSHEDWYYPVNESSNLHIRERYLELSAREPASDVPWLINDRKLDIIRFSQNTLWCDFTALCEQPRNAADYIAIAERIENLVLQNIPAMSADNDSEARRFITLIDVLYEQNVKVVAQAACHYKMIYQGNKLAFEFQRAASRLAELLLA